MTVGALMAFNFLIALANGPIKELLRIWDGYQTVSVLLNRLDDIFDQEPEQGHDHAQHVEQRGACMTQLRERRGQQGERGSTGGRAPVQRAPLPH